MPVRPQRKTTASKFHSFCRMEWVRGDPVGWGSFATVSLAIPRKGDAPFPPLTVVKSSDASYCNTLKNEKQVLDRLGDCPQIIKCFGDNYSFENGEELYNIFLEYATGGSLVDEMRRNGGKLPESDVRRYTRSILKGLNHIHSQGFVHCDIKLQNILMFKNGDVKIADFGLAKSSTQKQSTDEANRIEFRGTPLYMSPESLNSNVYHPSSDVWALGCAMVEMMTGKPAWNCNPSSNILSLMIRIGVGEELPEIPAELSAEGKDFLGRCLVKDPQKRWKAEELSNHPFVSDDTVQLKLNVDESSTSPRSHFDFPEWVSPATIYTPISPEWDIFSGKRCDFSFNSSSLCNSASPADRLLELLKDPLPNWSVSDSWITVR